MRQTSRFATLFAGVLAAQAAAQLEPLYPIPIFPAGSHATFAAGDLNLDGRLDAVSGALVTCLALPEGGFAPPVTSLLDQTPASLTIADVDGNGWPDVVAAIGIKEKFGVARNTGGGALAAAHHYYVGGKLSGAAAGDVDEDGFVDIVSCSNSAPVALNVNRSNHMLGYLATEAHPLAMKPSDVRLADLDGDGHLDAAFITQDDPDRALVAWGDGAAGFSAPVETQLAGSPSDLLVQDLDGDGDLDLAMPCSATAPHVSIVRGDGAGGLSAPEAWPVAPLPAALASGDVDEDGAVDLVVANTNQNLVSLLVADGLGGFAPAQLMPSMARNLGVFITDASGDDLPDIVAWSWSYGQLGILVGDGDGGFLTPQTLEIDQPEALAVADFDGDEHEDLLVFTDEADLVALLADGRGGYGSPVVTPVPLGFGGFEGLEAGDVTGDGLPEAVLLANDVVLLFPNDGAGVLLAPTVSPGLDNSNGLALADVDSDGLLDALACDMLQPAGPPYEGVIVRFLSAGAGGLQAPVSFPAGDLPFDLALGDLDGDAQLDAVTVDYQGPGASAMLGDGLGGFLPPLSSPFDINYSRVELGDLDLDGRLDAVAARGGMATLAVLLGDGAGGLQLASTVSDGGYQLEAELGIADVDGDGWPDVVLTGGSKDAMDVHRNDGAGGLLPAESFAAGRDPKHMALADLDGDHRTDIVAGDRAWTPFEQGMLSLLRNLADFRWTDLGFGKHGTAGVPQLVGTGALTPGSPGDLRLFHARPLSLAVLFVSGVQTPSAFKGGTLVPLPLLVSLVVVTDVAGSMQIAWLAWPSAAPGEDWYFQYAIKDAGAKHGVSLSNALKAVEP